MGIYKKILNSVIEFPTFFSVRAKDLIRKLLNPSIKKRWGVHDVKNFIFLKFQKFRMEIKYLGTNGSEE